MKKVKVFFTLMACLMVLGLSSCDGNNSHIMDIDVGGSSGSDSGSTTMPSEYIIFDLSTGTIVSYTGTGGHVTIPSSINGRLVTAIGDNAFNNKNLTSVIIPNSVNFIGAGAFAKNQLISITIGGNVVFNNRGVIIFDFDFDDLYINSNRAAGTYTRPDAGSRNWTRDGGTGGWVDGTGGTGPGGGGGQTFTITFDANGATSGTVPPPMAVAFRERITFPCGTGLSRLGYFFTGWNVDATGNQFVNHVGTTIGHFAAGSSGTSFFSDNTTLYAMWFPHTFSGVYFNPSPSATGAITTISFSSGGSFTHTRSMAGFAPSVVGGGYDVIQNPLFGHGNPVWIRPTVGTGTIHGISIHNLVGWLKR